MFEAKQPATAPVPTPLPNEAGVFSLPDHELAEQGLKLDRLHSDGVDFNLDNIQPLDVRADVATLGFMSVGNENLKVLGVMERGKLSKSMVFISPAEYDEAEAASQNAGKRPFKVVWNGRDEEIFGRESAGAGTLAFKDDSTVSRRHFGVTLAGDRLTIRDLGSLNGTKLVTAEMKDGDIERTVPRRLGGVALTEAHELRASNEAYIDGTKFTFEGLFSTSNRGNIFAVNSRDSEGNNRRFMVYRSNSEGGYRVSQGVEEDGRFLKGAELSSYFQYTQESQLHPEFAAALSEMQKVTLPIVQKDTFQVDEAQADERLKDFEAEISVTSFPDRKLAEQLAKVSLTGGLQKNALAKFLTVPEADTPKALMKYVDNLNKVLKKSKAIPDFSQPATRVQEELHPLLGSVRTEVYVRNVGGTSYEWYMSSDSTGRVWINRIRLADSKASVYGTDQSLVYSGILTSKPLEYIEQCDAVPQHLRKDFSGNGGQYKDISAFVETLLPVQQYKAQRGQRTTR